MNAVVELQNANVFYGGAQALHRVSLSISAGEAVAIVGRNGAGKTTILRTMMGLLPCAAGRRLMDGVDASHQSPEWINRAGISFVPEDRQVFSSLSVDENLRIATLVKGRRQGPRWSVEQIFELFPRLRERRNARAQMLSGGEQQMLSIGRALLCNPRLLLLDEPTEGLAPVVVDTLLQAMQSISRTGVAIVLIEQNLRVPRKVASRFVVVDSGEIRWVGSREELDAEQSRVDKLLSV